MATTSTRPAGTPNSAFTSSRMYPEQTITRLDSLLSHCSTPWMVRFISSGSQPWCRPASVAWIVLTSGMSRWSRNVIAVWATSQSWAWMTS